VVLCTYEVAIQKKIDVKDLEVQGSFYVRTSSPLVLQTLVRMLKQMLGNFVSLETVPGIDKITVPELIALISWKSGHLLEYFEECDDEDAKAAQAGYKERHKLKRNPDLMFHGTSRSASDGILELGFRKTKGARAKWGEGTYVTPAINEAWRYTAGSRDMTVLVCFMLVGQTAVGCHGQTKFVDSKDPKLPPVHTLTSEDRRIYVGSGEEGQIRIVARCSWTFVRGLMGPAILKAIGGGNNQVNAEYRAYLDRLPAGVRHNLQPWADVSAYNSNDQVFDLLPDRAQIVGAGGAAAGPVAAAAAAPAVPAAPAAAPAAAPSAAATQSNPKKRGGGPVAGSASKAPKREISYYVRVEQLFGLKVGDRVQIKNVFAPYRCGAGLIDDFACVRAIGRNSNRTLVLVEMEDASKTAFVKAANNIKSGNAKSAFPYVTWSSTEQQEDHLLAVRPGDVVRV
jgi:hypothetical protein